MHSRNCFFILLLSAVLPLYAFSGGTISFLVVETGLDEESPVPESSSLWEAAMMDAFFDAGYIVSSAPVLRLNECSLQAFPDEAKGDIEEAAENGVDFFVLAILEYSGEGENSHSAMKPEHISLQLRRLSPVSIVYEGKLNKPQHFVKKDDEFAFVKNSMKTLISRMKG